MEMAMHLTKAMLTQQMQSPWTPGLNAVKETIRTELTNVLGVEVSLNSLPDLAHFGIVGDY